MAVVIFSFLKLVILPSLFRILYMRFSLLCCYITFSIGIEVDTHALDEHAAEMGKVVAKLREMQESMNKGDEDLRYIE